MTVFIGQKRALLGGLIPPWVDPGALLAMQFGPDRYWRKRGGLLPATSVLTTTRSSGIVLPDSAGVFQTLDNNELPRTDRGLYVNGQVAALNVNGNNPQSATGWGNTGSPSVSNGPTIGSFFHSAYIASGGAGTDRRDAISISTVSGTPVPVKINYGLGQNDSGTIYCRFGSSFIAGVRGSATVVGESGGTLVIVSQSSTALYVIWTPNTTSASNFVSIGPNSATATKDIRLDGIDVTNVSTDAWVSTTSPAPTLLASDIRAVQGVRPDTSPEPFAGWEAAGLDSAFGGKSIVTIDRLNDAAARFITGAGVDADNLTKLIFDTDNRFKLIVRKSGVDEVALQTGAVASTGDKTIEWQAKPGDYGIDATGVTGDTDSDAETLPAGSTTLRIGSDFGVLNPFNGWIKELQILKVAA